MYCFNGSLVPRPLVRYMVLLLVWERDYFNGLCMDLDKDLLFLQYVHTYNKLNHSWLFCELYMWQSRVEIEGYSVAYFERIAAFKAPYR